MGVPRATWPSRCKSHAPAKKGVESSTLTGWRPAGGATVRIAAMVARDSGIVVRGWSGGVVQRDSRQKRRRGEPDLRIILMLGCPPLAMRLRRVHE
jgi:hypothetical protein